MQNYFKRRPLDLLLLLGLALAAVGGALKASGLIVAEASIIFAIGLMCSLGAIGIAAARKLRR